MKFSILLPTRNRLDLLQYAVESVRRQDYADWEIIISDNASAEDVSGYVTSLGDERIRYFRMEKLVPVTDNWNAALERSTGDYIIMLGDDDGLMAGCLTKASRLIREWNDPEVIYTQAIQFAYPGVIPGENSGFTQVAYNEFLLGREEPFMLGSDQALRMVRSALSFRLCFGFNMQHFIVGRALLTKLAAKGTFFKSPYPDYYAANAILLASNRILANPEPLVMIGISPKSFGYYYFNSRESEGVDFLQNSDRSNIPQHLHEAIIPGTNMNDSWLAAMDALVCNFPEIPSLKISFRRYRLLQFYAIWRRLSWRGLTVILKHMYQWEMVCYAPVVLAYAAAFVLPVNLRRKIQESLHFSFNTSPRFDVKKTTVPYRNLLEAVSQRS